ncbi:MAG: DUF4908 domain-containing protein [Caulobacterales bacterium]|nr:DUF4908 domain-containing protein [Caulobacterales bacterium]
MARTEIRFPAVVAIAAATLTLLCLCTAAPAVAQDASLKDFLFGDKRGESQRQAPPPPVARYVSETGEGFILDRSSERTLMRFESSPEIWVLQPTVGPRGDIIYKNDIGEVLLRATRVGGLTLFTGKRPAGAAASLAGAAGPIRLKAIGPGELLRILLGASVRASRLARHRISFESEATPASSTLIADAAVLSIVAIERLTQRADGAARTARIQRVVIVEGRRPDVILRAGTLLIAVTPSLGMAGRPSSERIAAVTAK